MCLCLALMGVVGGAAGQAPTANSPPPQTTPQTPGPAPTAAPVEAPAAGAPGNAPMPSPQKHSWVDYLIDPSVAPFIPVPEIDVDPNSGTTAGLIPTILLTNDRDEINKIIAPSIDHNPYFGMGIGLSLYSYPSQDTQWSVLAGAEQRVQKSFDYEYVAGRQRDSAWSFSGSLVYDRNGTPRFYGVGNNSPKYDVTDYTLQQKYVQTTLGYNVSHELQLAWVFRARDVDVQPGTLVRIETLVQRFGTILGVGVNHETLNRLEIIYDTRDDTIVPTRGGEYVLYGGVAGNEGVLDSNLYSATGIDARQLFPLGADATLVAHASLRYMPGVDHVPFWSLSEIGGDKSVIGEQQPLRGYGEGRFYGRNAFDSNIELRRRVASVDRLSTHINVEVTPFLDMGQVFERSRTFPLSHLHKVVGVGFRGIATPFVVGFVDVGYGSEGAAVFTGINYPF